MARGLYSIYCPSLRASDREKHVGVTVSAMLLGSSSSLDTQRDFVNFCFSGIRPI